LAEKGKKNMISLKKTYSGRFFRNRHKFAWRAKHICKAIDDIFHPSSVIDVGCAIGDIVKGFRDISIIADGIEGSTECKPYAVVQNLLYLDLRKQCYNLEVFKYDLATCFEVAEHIEEEYADQFITNLCNLSDKILMSYASPGQGGHSHVNCQFFEYWNKKFEEREYHSIDYIAELFKKELEPFRKKDGIKAFFNHNLVYFEKKNE